MILRFVRIILICCCITYVAAYDPAPGNAKEFGMFPGNGSFKVFGRLARTQEQSALSDGGLLGFCYLSPEDLMNMAYHSGPHNNGWQTQAYTARKCPLFNPYRSHPGGQAFLLYAVQQFSDSPDSLRLAPVFILGLLLALWLEWLRSIAGSPVMMAVLGFVLLSRWLLGFADNIGLFIGVLYFPLVAVSYVFLLNRRTLLFPVSFLAMLATLLLCGAEFISSVVSMTFLPVVYYSVLNRWSLRRVVGCSAVIAAGLGLAGLCAAIVLMLQLAQVMPAESIMNYFVSTAAKRSFGDPEEWTGHYRRALSVPFSVVLQAALVHPALQFLSIRLWFSHLLYIAVGAFVLALGGLGMRCSRKLKALMVTTCFAFLCSASWIVFFGAHVYMHPFMDPIVWYLPFLLYAAALLAAATQHIILYIVDELITTRHTPDA